MHGISFYRLWNLSGTMVIDGIYLISMNHRLREAARLSEQASRLKRNFSQQCRMISETRFLWKGYCIILRIMR